MDREPSAPTEAAIEFPIYTVSKQRTRTASRHEVLRRLRALDSAHAINIEALQPYRRGNGGRRSRLWRLSELNNADKHRLLQAAAVASSSVSYGYWGDDLPPGSLSINLRTLLVDGAKIGTASRFLVETKRVTHFKLRHDVAFGNGCLAVRGLPVVPFLRNTSKEVREVIEMFEGAIA